MFMDLLQKMMEKSGIDAPIVNLYAGEAVEEDNARALVETLEASYPDAEFLLTVGDQPLYYYYLSVE